MERDSCDSMELKLLKKEENKLEVVLLGENHTFASLLRIVLKEDEHVIFAAYKVGHPLLDKGRPILFVKTDGKETPQEALVKAAKRMKGKVNEFGRKFEGIR